MRISATRIRIRRSCAKVDVVDLRKINVGQSVTVVLGSTNGLRSMVRCNCAVSLVAREACAAAERATRWITTLSSEVNLPYAINLKVFCAANLFTHRFQNPKEQNLRTVPCRGEHLARCYTLLPGRPKTFA
jgi:hypothetical protein